MTSSTRRKAKFPRGLSRDVVKNSQPKKKNKKADPKSLKGPNITHPPDFQSHFVLSWAIFPPPKKGLSRGFWPFNRALAPMISDTRLQTPPNFVKQNTVKTPIFLNGTTGQPSKRPQVSLIAEYQR